MKLSILTATYNRGKYLNRIYESIISNQKNSNLEVEWIIIDDGSIDNTNDVVIKIIQKIKETEQRKNKSKINIKYIYQPNKGKMEAINRGMEEVTGDLVVDCDSDDYFSENAFYTIEQNIERLLEYKDIYGLCFLKQDIKGNISGKEFKTNYKESTMFDLYFKEKISGEKILVFDSKIRKQFKHELEGKEKFITEARMYHKMDEKYKILCINETIEIGEYINDGYTKNIKSIFKNNPKGYYIYFKEILQKGLKGVTLKKKIYVIKHYLYFWILNIIKNRQSKL